MPGGKDVRMHADAIGVDNGHDRVRATIRPRDETARPVEVVTDSQIDRWVDLYVDTWTNRWVATL